MQMFSMQGIAKPNKDKNIIQNTESSSFSSRETPVTRKYENQ